MLRRALASAIVVAFALPATGRAQVPVAVGAHAGTTGLGATAVVGVTSFLNVRGSAALQPVEPDFALDGVDYTVSLPSPQFLLTANLHPGGAGVYLSAGFLISGDDLAVEGNITQDVEIGGNTYTPQEIGTLRGELDGNDVAPYLGVGIGNPVGDGKRLGFFTDLGIAFTGKPEVTLESVGGTLAPSQQVQLDSDLLAEEANVSEDALKIWPVVSVGLSLRIGR